MRIPERISTALYTTMLGHMLTVTHYLRHFWASKFSWTRSWKDNLETMHAGTHYLRHFWATCIPKRIIYVTFGPHAYRNVLFATLLSYMYTGTNYLRHFWATCIPERIIYDTFGPHVYRNILFATLWRPYVYRNVLFTTRFGHMFTGTLYLRQFSL